MVLKQNDIVIGVHGYDNPRFSYNFEAVVIGMHDTFVILEIEKGSTAYLGKIRMERDRVTLPVRYVELRPENYTPSLHKPFKIWF